MKIYVVSRDTTGVVKGVFTSLELAQEFRSTQCPAFIEAFEADPELPTVELKLTDSQATHIERALAARAKEYHEGSDGRSVVLTLLDMVKHAKHD